MSLKALCMKNLVELIQNLPPMMKEEVIGKSLEAIENDAKKKVMKEIRRSAAIVTEDVTERIIDASKKGQSWQRPGYTIDIDDELYYTCVDIAQKFVDNNSEKLIFSNGPRYRRQSAVYMENDSDEDINNYDQEYEQDSDQDSDQEY